MNKKLEKAELKNVKGGVITNRIYAAKSDSAPTSVYNNPVFMENQVAGEMPSFEKGIV
jgi:hypothetical protein